MPSYSERSKRNLQSVHPDLQKVFNLAIKQMDIIVIEGIRGKERQNKLYEEGRSELKWPKSNHNVRQIPNPPEDPTQIKDEYKATAVDALPYPIDWKDIERFKRLGFYILGIADALYEAGKISHRVRWGADWDRDMIPVDKDSGENFMDCPHYELVFNGS